MSNRNRLFVILFPPFKVLARPRDSLMVSSQVLDGRNMKMSLPERAHVWLVRARKGVDVCFNSGADHLVLPVGRLCGLQ